MSLRSELVTLLKTTGMDVYADTPPEGVAYPFIIISVDHTVIPLMGGDARTLATRRLAQVSLWQELATESEDIGESLYELLDGYQIVGPGGLRVSVTNVIRYGDPDYPLIHRVYDLSIASLRP